tara:strand:+ start:7271 stop:7825 length:555 start_codon:yes stop_codon:yes gene_type:complete
MDLQIMVQDTPNPNAKKFVMNKPVKREGKSTYHNQEETFNNILAHDLMGVAHVDSVHFFKNVITVTQDGMAEWEDLEWLVKAILETRMPIHNPDYQDKPAEPQEKPKPKDPELLKIDEILDRTVRSALQVDGGDIELLAIEDNYLMVRYLGACGSCPASTAGTLQAIQSILRDEYRDDIQVVIA